MKQVLLPGASPDPDYGDALDFYETPRWAVEAIVPIVKNRMNHCKAMLIDPGCGRGNIGRYARPHLRELVSTAIGIELDQARADEARALGEFDVVTVGDWCSWEPQGWLETILVMGNPPYGSKGHGTETIALEFVEHAIEIAKPSEGLVAMLLQLDFAHGVDRCKRIHDKHKSGLYPLRRRPGFGGEYSSGQRPFAWFVWDLGAPYSDWQPIG